MITESTIYWITRLDTFVLVFQILAITLSTAMGLFTLVGGLALYEGELKRKLI